MSFERRSRDAGTSRSSDASAPAAAGRMTLTDRLTPSGAPSVPDHGPDHGAAYLAAPVQTRTASSREPAEDPFALHLAAEGIQGPSTSLPHLDRIQASFGAGHDLSAVPAHVGGAAGDAAQAMGATAYASAGHVAFASPPDLHTAAHEAAHVVQQRQGVQLYGGVGVAGDPYERAADAVADRVVAGQPAADLLGAPTVGGAVPVQTSVQRHEDEQKEYGGERTAKDDSARFEGDKSLEEVKDGTKKVGTGGRGLTVTKLQQALIDLGYLLPKHGVDGKFEGETKAALLKFQKDAGVGESGELDQDTINALHTRYDTRQPYVDRAPHDPADPGTRTLSAGDKRAAVDAMVPAKGAGGAPPVFTEDVAGEKYGDRIGDALAKIIAKLHKVLYEDKVGLRADPKANFHEWSALEGPAEAAKDVTDAVYATNYGGKAAFPAMTHAGGNLVDQWEDELSLNAGLTPAQLKDKAEGKVWYLINSNCTEISREHGAVPSAAKEKAILTPIVADLVSTPAKVQTMLDLDIGWEGAQLDGTVYLQRYKSTDPDKTAAKEQDRVQMWELFNTCIHEYIHTLAHKDYKAWANGFRAKGDVTRYNTLIEGFCDFFTLNVRATVAPDAALQAKVEGPYANGNPPAAVKSGVYPSHQQAEQVVSIVGVKNAQAAYFRGETKLMGKT